MRTSRSRSNSVISLAVTGASRIPLRKWPVAKIRFFASPNPIIGVMIFGVGPQAGPCAVKSGFLDHGRNPRNSLNDGLQAFRGDSLFITDIFRRGSRQHRFCRLRGTR